MKKIGFGLLACSAVCLIIGVILLPMGKHLFIDFDGIAVAVVWLVLGYVFGQAGLFIFISSLIREKIEELKLKLDMLPLGKANEEK